MDAVLAKRFLDVLYPTRDGLEIRFIPDDKTSGLPVYSIWPRDGELIWPEIMKANGQGYGVFIGVNPRADPKGKANAENVAEVRCLFVDLDGKSFDKANWQHGKQLALERLRHALPELMQPTILVDSAHGVHGYWLLNEPVLLDNINGWRAKWEAQQRALGAYLGGDEVFDLPRVMRLPGTENCKDGRVGVNLLQCEPARTFSFSDFDDWCPGLVAGSGQAGRVDAPKLSIQEIYERVGRNNALTSMAGALRRRGTPDDVILASLKFMNAKYDPPLSDNELEYIARGITRYPVTEVPARASTKGSPSLCNDALEYLLMAGMVLSGGKCISLVSQSLQDEDLYNPDTARVYALLKTYVGNGAIDLPIVQAQLRRSGEHGLAVSLGEWCNAQDVTADCLALACYADILSDLAASRRMVQVADEVLAASHSLSPDKAQEYALTLLQDAAMRRNRKENGGMEWAIGVTDTDRNKGFTTGLASYDCWCGGFVKGHYHAIGGYRGSGKSFFMLGRALEAARAGATVCFFSLELPLPTLVDRLRGYITGIDWRLLQATRQPGLTRWEAKMDATAELIRLRDRLFLFDRQRTIMAIRMVIALKNPDVAFVDYLQHISGDAEEYRRITAASLAIQEMANQEQVCMVVGNQIALTESGREVDVREFKGSGAIVADSTIAILLHRDKKVSPKILNVRVVKNQVGPDECKVSFQYEPSTGQLKALERVMPESESEPRAPWIDD